MNPVYGQSVGMPYAADGFSYPVDVRYPEQQSYKKLWAVPIVGYTLKLIILLPHLVLLYLLNLVVALLQYVLWIPVLFTGRYPEWGHMLVGGTLSWSTRVTAYLFGLSDTYPAFSLSAPPNGMESQMLFQPTQQSNRLYAVPAVGYVVKCVMLIPHLVIVGLLTMVVLLAQLVAWFPVLTSGQFPAWNRTLSGGWLRWTTRVYAFWFGLTDVYPPFRLES